MKIGVFTVLFAQRPFEEALDYIRDAGVEAVEIGTGGAPGNSHCDVDRLVDNADAQRAYVDAITSRGLEISALSCHGNPLHPNKEAARADDESFRKTVRLASQIGVQNVITFSGCPGDSETAKYPNWVTCPWPTEYADMLKWQWDEVARPYWSEAGKFAADNGVRVAIELHPGFLGYHTESFWRLREIGGDAIGVNFDPSHLFWQGMDERHLAGRAEHQAQRRPRHQAVHRRGQPILDFPHGRVRPWTGVLALADFRASARGIRRRALDRARRFPDEHQRGLPESRRVPEAVGDPRNARRSLVGIGIQGVAAGMASAVASPGHDCPSGGLLHTNR
jgi:sugar phosphate isomerase/epimerase